MTGVQTVLFRSPALSRLLHYLGQRTHHLDGRTQDTRKLAVLAGNRCRINNSLSGSRPVPDRGIIRSLSGDRRIRVYRMAEALPRNIQQKLNQTLAQWASWRTEPALTAQPEIQAPLRQGQSNHSILVGTEQRFVVRIDGQNPAVIGLNRQTEWRVLQNAAAAGIAPQPVYYNPELGALVTEYLPSDEIAPHTPQATASLLRQIHQLPQVHFRLDLAERMQRYEKHIEHQGHAPHPVLQAHRKEVLTLINVTASEHATPVLCHNDLLRANRLSSGGKLWAIDWEYSAMGNAWFDLAVVSVGDGLSASDEQQLLSGYLGREAGPEEWQEFSRHKSIYRYLELLWFSALDDAEAREEHLTSSRLEQFQTQLGA